MWGRTAVGINRTGECNLTNYNRHSRHSSLSSLSSAVLLQLRLGLPVGLYMNRDDCSDNWLAGTD